jgi:hypothetical protein
MISAEKPTIRPMEMLPYRDKQLMLDKWLEKWFLIKTFDNDDKYGVEEIQAILEDEGEFDD